MTPDAEQPDPRPRGVPDRLLLPPGPRDPELARRWRRLPFEHRRRLASASSRPDAMGERDLDTADAELVAAVARARVTTSWRLHVAAPVLGWLVLMTLWGFGRSSFPDQEPAWLAAGLAAGALVWAGAAAAARRRVARARRVAQQVSSRQRPDQ